MAEAEKSTDPIAIPLRSGLAQGGLGGSGNELLDDGQEEVFSRYEVEHGLIEHHTDAGDETVAPDAAPFGKP